MTEKRQFHPNAVADLGNERNLCVSDPTVEFVTNLESGECLDADKAIGSDLVKAMPVKTVAAYVGEHDTRLWRIVHHYVDQARERADFSEITRFGVDETACKRGHNYVSLFVDLQDRKVLFATEGKDSSTVERFKQDFSAHGGCPERVEEACCDMSTLFSDTFRSTLSTNQGALTPRICA